MPMITIQYDDAIVTETEVNELAIAIQKIVSEVTEIEDVFVYANTAHIKVKIAPIEIFINMSAHKIPNATDLITKIKNRLIEWKLEVNYKQPINLTLSPMQWNMEIGI
jgi:hypothetical protein